MFFVLNLLNSIVFNLDASDSSSDDEETSDRSSFNEEDSLEEDEVIDINEQPVFDSSKEINYKIKYKQTFEELIGLNDVYVLKLDAHKM